MELFSSVDDSNAAFDIEIPVGTGIFDFGHRIITWAIRTVLVLYWFGNFFAGGHKRSLPLTTLPALANKLSMSRSDM
jgi:hypothetical protein